MDTTIPEIIRRYLDAYNARDIDALLDTVNDDVVFEHVSNEADPVRVEGKAALGHLARQSAASFSSRRQTVRTCVATAEAVAIEVEFEATPAVDLPNGWKAGEQVRLRGGVVLHDPRRADCGDQGLQLGGEVWSSHLRAGRTPWYAPVQGRDGRDEPSNGATRG